MAVLVDARPYAAAIKTAIKAEFDERDVYEYGEVPGDTNAATEQLRSAPVPPIYAIVSIERRFNPVRRATSQTSLTGWRVAVRCMGTTVGEARWAMFAVARALDEKRLTVSGAASTALVLESEDAPVWDDGRFAGLAVFTFSH